jgi:hypothetical protein
MRHIEHWPVLRLKDIFIANKVENFIIALAGQAGTLIYSSLYLKICRVTHMCGVNAYAKWRLRIYLPNLDKIQNRNFAIFLRTYRTYQGITP